MKDFFCMFLTFSFVIALLGGTAYLVEQCKWSPWWFLVIIIVLDGFHVKVD